MTRIIKRSGDLRCLTLTAILCVSPVSMSFAQMCFNSPNLPPMDQSALDSVVITDQAVIGNKNIDFSMKKTIGAIIASALGSNANTQAEQISLLTSMIRSFRVPEIMNGTSKASIPVTSRPGEAALDPIKMLNSEDIQDGFKVVGLFNRFDLAASDFSDCGEYRIVYERAGGASARTKRMTLIFEAKLDNPDPSNSPQGCRPVAEFWNNLGKVEKAQQAQLLHSFYYEGLKADGLTYDPVVTHKNYGVPLGQVRGNLFIDQPNFLWQLREWRIGLNADKAPTFISDTVKVNPHPELFRSASSGEPEFIASLRKEFGASFVDINVDEITKIDRSARSDGGKARSSVLLSGVAAFFPDQFNDVESTSTKVDDPLDGIDPDLISRVRDKLRALRLDSDCGLTPQHIVARAGALTCGGCHEFSKNQAVAPNVLWPEPKDGFVHIDENGGLSPALLQSFLPERRQILVDFIKSAPPASVATLSLSKEVARTTFTALVNTTTREDALRLVLNLESNVAAARSLDAQTKGAFRNARRSH